MSGHEGDQDMDPENDAAYAAEEQRLRALSFDALEAELERAIEEGKELLKALDKRIKELQEKQDQQEVKKGESAT